MRRILPLAGLATLLVTACGQDVTTSNGSGTGPVVIQATPPNSCTPVMTAAQITADVNSLMAYLTPNNQSAQSKWTTIQADLAAHNIAQAQTDLQTLINFIELKYGQANTNGVLISGVPIADFKNNLIAGLSCYVSLHSFDINPGDPPKVFVNSGATAGFYAPEDFAPRGYNVRLTTPAASSLVTPLDKYASFINIEFVDGDGVVAPPGSIQFNFSNGFPVVVVCFPTDGSMPAAAQDRALLGHQASTGFELLPPVAVPALLANALACGSTLTIETTPIGRLFRKAADWVLPQKVYAKFFGRAGAGGSPEEFSPFGAVDPGLFVGGAGGSPEEFAPPVGAAPAVGGLMNSTVSGGGTNVTGTADESDVTDPAQLPKVRVVTAGLANPIAGVIVTWEIIPPVTVSPTSNAALCGQTVTSTTDADGYASVPCINFGTLPGYKNLRATFDPTGVDPLACIVGDTGLCATATTSRNFLVETVKGAPTLNVSPLLPAAVTVGTGVGPLTAKVADAVTPVPNPYPGVTVSVTGPAAIECLPLAVPADHSCQSATTNGSGEAMFAALTSRTPGSYTLTFRYSVDANPANDLTRTVNVIFNAGPASKLVIVAPTSPTLGGYGSAFAAFATVSPAPLVKTTDLFDNVVSGSVFWKLADASVSAGSTISGTTGLSVGWTLGDGFNELKAYLGSIGSATSVTFSATPAAASLATLAACSASGTIKKTDLALYSSATAGYTGYFSYPADAKGLIRKVQVQVSVTGQSSGSGDYVTTGNVYRRKADGTRGDLIATGKPNTTVLKLPGNNSSPTAIDFTLAPAVSPVVNSVVNAGEIMIFELKITAPSTRTFQVWYNTKPAGSCLNSKLYTPSTTVPNFNTGSFLAGLLLKVTN